MPLFLQPSFAKGEVGADLYGRVDTAALQVALRKALNFIIHPYGGASNRPGLEYIGSVYNHAAAPSLVPFQFKTTDSYMLEFGGQYIRFIRNGGYVLEATKAITGITSAQPGVVTAVGHGYATGQEVFLASIAGMTQLNGRAFKIVVTGADTFELYDQATGLPVNTAAYSAYTSGGTAARLYMISSPYAIGDVPTVNYVQNADRMTLVHRSYPVYELSRTGHTAWTLALAVFATWHSAAPTGQAVTPNTVGAVTYQYKVTALQALTQEESLAGYSSGHGITAATNANPGVFTSAGHGLLDGDDVIVGWSVAPGGAWQTAFPQSNSLRYTITNKTTNTFQLLRGDGTVVDTTSLGAYPGNLVATRRFVRITNGNATANNTVSWAATSGAEKYRIYKFDNGTFGFIGETTATSFLDDNIAANLSRTPPTARDPFTSANNYPGAVTYYEQRRVFASTVNAPDTTWYSQIGRPNNLNVSSPLLDDDAITASLNSREVNQINHLVPDDDLLAFTSGSEWKINSGPDAAFTPTSVKQRQQSNWGSSGRLRPITIGSTTLYVEESESSVRSFGFSFQLDKYTGNRLDILAPHLFEFFKLVNWSGVHGPETRVYGVREDGMGVTMTFDQEQEVIAWTRWETNGKFERVSSLRNPATGGSVDHSVYFVVKRRVNGTTVRYIEKLASRRLSDIRDAFFVDSGLSYDSPITVSSIDAVAGTTQITATAHGLTNGQKVEFSGIVWDHEYDEFGNPDTFNELNNKRYLVANAAANTFTIQDIDTGLEIDSASWPDYMESGYVRRVATTFTGWWHLEGKNLSVLADGNVVEGVTVVNGGFTLPDGAARLHAGLGYISDFETLDLEQNQRTTQGLLKKVNRIAVRLKASREFLVGHTFAKLYEPSQRDLENVGTPGDPITGVRDFPMPADWNNNGRICIRMVKPLPLTILSVRADVTIGG